MRVLFYSHDHVGLGHTRRHVAVAARLADIVPDASVLFAVGRDDVSRLGLPRGVELIKLPALGDIGEPSDGRPLDALTSGRLALRAGMLETLVRSYRPDVMIVDRHPLGAGGELRPALDAMRMMGGAAVLGVPDIVNVHERAKDWSPAALDAIVRCYDSVLVYGERRLFDPAAACGWPPSVAERVHFCGYVVGEYANEMRREDAPPRFLARRRARPLVVATVRSSAPDSVLLDTFIDAATDAPWDAAIVLAPASHAARDARLSARAAEAGIECVPSVPGLGRWFGAIDGLVTSAGYNTLMEALVSGLPTVCVPGSVRRPEQQLRAAAFSRLGLLRVIDESRLSPATLRRAVGLALATARTTLAERSRRALDLDGARRAAEHLATLATARYAATDVTAAHVAVHAA
jgi:predicted glycosyltransferase